MLEYDLTDSEGGDLESPNKRATSGLESSP